MTARILCDACGQNIVANGAAFELHIIITSHDRLVQGDRKADACSRACAAELLIVAARNMASAQPAPAGRLLLDRRDT